MNIGQFDCFLLAGRYSLLEQAPLQQLLPKCEKHGASIILGGPYNSGILATGVNGNTTPYYDYAPAPKHIIERVAKIEAVCEQYQVTLAAAALQFPLGHSAVASVIPGLGSTKRVQHTIELFNEAIPGEFWQTLKNESLLEQAAPVPSTVVSSK
jgi:D-threo-aldose 1-dehydrogenase